MKHTVTDVWQLTNAINKKQNFKFAEHGCLVHELEFPRMLRSKSLLSALKKSRCPIKRIAFTNESDGPDKKKLKKLVESIRINRSIRTIKLMDMVLDGSTAKLDVFLENALDVIRAMKNIRTIELSYFGSDHPALERFFDALKEIKFRQLKIQLCSFSLQTLFAYMACTKYQPILKFTNMEEVRVTALLQDQSKNGGLNDLVLTDISLTVEQWKILLSLDNINSISILRCYVSLSIWKQISDLVVQNRFIKALDITAQTLTLSNFEEIIANNRYLQRFGKRARSERDFFDNEMTFATFARAMRNNSTLTYMDIRALKTYYEPLADILTHHKCLKTLCLDLDVAFEDGYANGFWKFIEALKNNITLTALKFDHVYFRKYRTMEDVHKDPFRVDPVIVLAEVLKVNKTLVYISRFDANENLINNRISHDRAKWNSIWFVHMIKRNPSLMNQLPLEVWLNIVTRLGVDGLDKILMTSE